MVADELDYVVGVATHLDEHVLAVVAAPSGGCGARQWVRASARGYSAALRFAGEEAAGARVWAIEGTGSYGCRFRAVPRRPGGRARDQPYAAPRQKL